MIFLVMGTNIGERESNLKRAMTLLAERLKVDMNCSEVMETDAVGFDGPAFLNQAVAFESSVAPEDLLDLCQDVEREMGRPCHGPVYDGLGRRVYENRVIDIDILIYNELKIDTPRLKVPHPQLWERPYIDKLLKTIKI